MHIPKTAGLSTARYILRRVGWRRTRRSAGLAEMPWNLPVASEDFEKANAALFVFGHMSFASIDRLDGSRPNYIFTFLREPKARLWSLYRHLHTYLEKFPLQPTHRSYPLMVKCSRLTPEEFFLSDDPTILALTDNQMVRQFAGRMAGYPNAETEWPEILDRAKTNFRRVDFVGFQENYAEDFRALLKEIKLAQPRVVPHTNKALDSDKVGAPEDYTAEMHAAIDRLSKWDSLFFEFALQSKHQKRAGRSAGSRAHL